MSTYLIIPRTSILFMYKYIYELLLGLLAVVPAARRPLGPGQGLHGAQVVLRRRQDARRQRGAPALQGDAADPQAEEGNALPGLCFKKNF